MVVLNHKHKHNVRCLMHATFCLKRKLREIPSVLSKTDRGACCMGVVLKIGLFCTTYSQRNSGDFLVEVYDIMLKITVYKLKSEK